jgi:hypothetical protein
VSPAWSDVIGSHTTASSVSARFMVGGPIAPPFELDRLRRDLKP